MGKKFAEGTSVPTERSRTEIEKMLTARGATQLLFMSDEFKAVVGFRAYNRVVRFLLPLPNPAAKEFRTGRSRTPPSERCAAETRRRWRCLHLAIKAKLQTVADGIETFEEAFLAQIVTAQGPTVGEKILPMIQDEYETGKPALLALGSGAPN